MLDKVFSHSSVQFSSVQLLSRVRLFAIPWIAARQASLPITNSQSLPKLMCIESVMPSSHFILCRPLLLPPPIPPSIRVFSNESTLRIRWPKYWSFGLSSSPSNEHPGLVSFRMDCLDLLAFQGTRKSLIQHHSSKASILQCSAFFTVQLSHPNMTTGKIIALTRWTFVGKVISLLFNMLSKLVITFLRRSKHLLISWLQSQNLFIQISFKRPDYSNPTLKNKYKLKINRKTVPPNTVIKRYWHKGSPFPSLSISVFSKFSCLNICWFYSGLGNTWTAYTWYLFSDKYSNKSKGVSRNVVWCWFSFLE